MVKAWLAGVMLVTAVTAPVYAQLTLDLSHRARDLHPGEVVVLEVRPSEDLALLSATAFGNSLNFFRTSNEVWMALLGIDLTTEPGSYDVSVIATAQDGVVTRRSYTLSVEPKDFPIRRLSVDPSFVSPPASVIDRIQREARQLNEIFATATDERLWSGGFLRPVPGDSTSSFGRRSVFNGQPRSPHSGTDFRGAEGTPIKAPNAGIVALATDLYFSGNVVIIDHGWGLYSYFAHLSSIAVDEGSQVKQGDVVGDVGSTGRVTGPHLHWTVRLNDARVDPLSLMTLFPQAQ